MTTLVFILGDQLSPGLASLRGCDPADTVVLLAEVEAEATHVRHHRKKLAFVFAAMRHHADALRAEGWRVDYTPLDAPGNAGTLTGELARAVARHRPSRIRTVEAGEWRVIAMQEAWAEMFDAAVEILPDDRFIVSRWNFDAENRKPAPPSRPLVIPAKAGTRRNGPASIHQSASGPAPPPRRAGPAPPSRPLVIPGLSRDPAFSRDLRQNQRASAR